MKKNKLPLILALLLCVGCAKAGPKGDTGNGIEQIEKTSTQGNVDTYTITFTDGRTYEFIVVNGTDGAQGIQGIPGQDGHTPVITIGSNGNWYVDGIDTGVHAQGEKGDKGDKGDTGAQGEKGETGNGIVSVTKVSSTDNLDTYQILYTDGTTTYFVVTNGTDGAQGIQGIPGQDGHTPVITIGSNGNWYVDGIDTGVHAQGEKGDKGDKGDTGAQGEKGDTGLSAYQIYLKYYPKYSCSEKDWIDDLTQGLLNDKYTITWKNYDGTILEIDSNVSRREIPEYNGIIPTKQNDTFSEWSPSIEPATNNVTYYAQYINTKAYKVTWKNYDGSILEIDENVIEGSIPTYDGIEPFKEGNEKYSYNFDQWDKEINEITSDITYIARFVEIDLSNWEIENSNEFFSKITKYNGNEKKRYNAEILF